MRSTWRSAHGSPRRSIKASGSGVARPFFARGNRWGSGNGCSSCIVPTPALGSCCGCLVSGLLWLYSSAGFSCLCGLFLLLIDGAHHCSLLSLKVLLKHDVFVAARWGSTREGIATFGGYYAVHATLLVFIFTVSDARVYHP